MAEPTYTYRCDLVRVIDGDTVVVDVDLGFRLTARLPIRLLGIDTPERHEPGWSEAREFTQRWCDDHADLSVVTQKSPEKYGRWLGTIQAVDASRTLNDSLLEAELAKPYDGGTR